MNRKLLITASAMFAYALFAAKPPANYMLPQELQQKKLIECSQKTIAKGVTYLSAHFANLLGDGPVSTHWLVIEWDKCDKGISLNIARNPVKRECPSLLAESTKAIACVNGTYHTTVDPSTPVYQLKVRGDLIPSQNTGGDGSMAFNKGEMPFIGNFSKELLEKYENVISGDGVPGRGQPLPDYSDKSPAARAARENCRAPRTFIGNILTNNTTVIGIADGRQPKHSIGVNYVELRYLLETWGCDPSALVSLDGGGSTMMGIKKGSKVEVKNRPSDGRERRVAESIQIIDAKSKPDAKIKSKK